MCEFSKIANLVKSIFQKNYRDINKQILGIHGEKVKLNLFYYFIGISQYVSDDVLFFVIYLITHKINHNKIHYDALLNILRENGRHQTHIFLKYCQNRKKLGEKLVKSAHIFAQTTGTIKHVFGNKCTINSYKKLCSASMHIMSAFSVQRFINIIKLIRIVPEEKRNVWCQIHTKEVVARLQQLVLIFGLDILKHHNIKILSRNMFDTLTLEQKIAYYVDVVGGINNMIKINRKQLIDYDRLCFAKNKFGYKVNSLCKTTQINPRHFAKN